MTASLGPLCGFWTRAGLFLRSETKSRSPPRDGPGALRCPGRSGKGPAQLCRGDAPSAESDGGNPGAAAHERLRGVFEGSLLCTGARRPVRPVQQAIQRFGKGDRCRRTDGRALRLTDSLRVPFLRTSIRRAGRRCSPLAPGSVASRGGTRVAVERDVGPGPVAHVEPAIAAVEAIFQRQNRGGFPRGTTENRQSSLRPSFWANPKTNVG